MDFTHIKDFTPEQLEAVVEEYPWFSYARELMLVKLADIGDEVFETQLRNSAIFLHSREHLYLVIEERKRRKKEEEKKEIAGNREVAKIPAVRYVVAGGDYFSSADFEELEKDEKPVGEEKAGNEVNAGSIKAESSESSEAGESSVDFDNPEFCTETLGEIYAQQGYYEQAIEIFSRLSLLYPQKSAYFAALIREMKDKKES